MIGLLVLGCAVSGCSAGGGVGAMPLTTTQAASAAMTADVSHFRREPIGTPASAAPAAAPSDAPSGPPSVVARILGSANDPSPSPAPTAKATSVAIAVPAVVYPVYSSYFTGKTPFHDTVAQLMGAGAKVLSPTLAQNFWKQGVGSVQPENATNGAGSLYFVRSGDPSYTFTCREYGSCNANGASVHFPSDALATTNPDHHLATFDAVYAKAEIDGWGGDPAHPCTLGGGSANCTWGGIFPFTGSGLATDNSAGNASGYSQGLMNVSAQEVLNGHIDHALGMISGCLDNGGVYPASNRGTDTACPAALEPMPAYGDMIHLKSSVDVDAYGFSPFCATIVRAFQKYGAYTSDTNGNRGVSLEVEAPHNPLYATDPWNTVIFPSMIAGGDASGSGSNFTYSTCLQRIPASDIEVIQISNDLP